MASSAAIDPAFVPTPSERALLTAWRQLPARAAAALLALNVAFVSDYGLGQGLLASTPEAASAALSDPADADPETS